MLLEETKHGYVISGSASGRAISALRDLVRQRGKLAMEAIKRGDEDGAGFYGKWAAQAFNAMDEIDKAPHGEAWENERQDAEGL